MINHFGVYGKSPLFSGKDMNHSAGCKWFLLGCVLLLALGCSRERRPPQTLGEKGTVQDGITLLESEPSPSDSIKHVTDPTNPKGERADYIIRRGDVLEISVLGEPDMTKTVPVRPDGKISYFLISEVMAAGKTFGELETIVEKKLKEYIRNPDAAIIGKEFKGNLCTVLGLVKKPGRYHVSTNTRLLDVLAMANGISNIEGGGAFASSGLSSQLYPDLESSYIIRKGQILNVNFYALLKEKKMRNNIIVVPGDFIYIPSSVDNKVHVVGEVQRQVTLNFGNSITLVEAINGAGGLNIRSSDGWVYVVRGSLRKPQVYRMNIKAIYSGRTRNLRLKSGDIVYATSGFLTKVERVTTKVIPFLDVLLKSESLRSTIKKNY